MTAAREQAQRDRRPGRARRRRPDRGLVRLVFASEQPDRRHVAEPALAWAHRHGRVALRELDRVEPFGDRALHVLLGDVLADTDEAAARRVGAVVAGSGHRCRLHVPGDRADRLHVRRQVGGHEDPAVRVELDPRPCLGEERVRGLASARHHEHVAGELAAVDHDTAQTAAVPVRSELARRRPSVGRWTRRRSCRPAVAGPRPPARARRRTRSPPVRPASATTRRRVCARPPAGRCRRGRCRGTPAAARALPLRRRSARRGSGRGRCRRRRGRDRLRRSRSPVPGRAPRSRRSQRRRRARRRAPLAGPRRRRTGPPHAPSGRRRSRAPPLGDARCRTGACGRRACPAAPGRRCSGGPSRTPATSSAGGSSCGSRSRPA